MNLDFSFHMNTNPTHKALLDPERKYDVIIIGAGPAGLNAALYAKRKGLDVAVISKKKGGQVLDTASVDNYLGITNRSGEALVADYLNHLQEYQVPILDDTEVVDFYTQDLIHYLILSNGEIYQSRSLIFATGSTPRRLEVQGEKEFAGNGVAYCAICDAPLFKNKEVIIAGGGNSAVEAALDLAKVATSVTLVHRSQLRADHIVVEELYHNPKIKVLLESQILEILGDSRMTGIAFLDKATGAIHQITADGIFIEIGHLPNVGPWAKKLEKNSLGEILTTAKKQTNLPGIFVAGDVSDTPYKQISIAVSDGAIAALAANDYLNQHPII